MTIKFPLLELSFFRIQILFIKKKVFICVKGKTVLLKTTTIVTYKCDVWSPVYGGDVVVNTLVFIFVCIMYYSLYEIHILHRKYNLVHFRSKTVFQSETKEVEETILSLTE